MAGEIGARPEQAPYRMSAPQNPERNHSIFLLKNSMASNQPPREDSPLPAPDPGTGDVADEQLLGGFRHLLGHELPNQMIALQGLLRLIETDESAGLTPGGRELLERVGALAQHIHEMVQEMAELCRLRYNSDPLDDLSFAEVAREAAAETSQLSPGRAIEYDFPDAGVRLAAHRQLLKRVLVELARWILAADPAASHNRIYFEARALAAATELRIRNSDSRVATEAFKAFKQALMENVPAALANQLGLFLVRQVVERRGGTVAVEAEGDQGVSVSIRWPAGK
jgi:light-regulated signal transduction histidine kinase (bacteriophytochrome)